VLSRSGDDPIRVPGRIRDRPVQAQGEVVVARIASTFARRPADATFAGDGACFLANGWTHGLATDQCFRLATTLTFSIPRRLPFTATAQPLDEVPRAVRLRYMASVRISTVAAPFDRPALVDPAIRLLRRALALGLLADNERVDRLDLELVRRIAQEASAAGIGQDAAVALLQGVSGPNRLAALIERLDDSLTESPLPDRELPELLRVFGREDVAVLTGTSGVSLGRYVAGSRKWPDELATRIHWLALVLSDLAGAYNEFGARRWFERERTQLGGRSPRQVLGTEWDPGSPDVEKVRQLAASLAGVGAAT
jgi:hypothetical protein